MLLVNQGLWLQTQEPISNFNREGISLEYPQVAHRIVWV